MPKLTVMFENEIVFEFFLTLHRFLSVNRISGTIPSEIANISYYILWVASCSSVFSHFLLGFCKPIDYLELYPLSYSSQHFSNCVLNLYFILNSRKFVGFWRKIFLAEQYHQVSKRVKLWMFCKTFFPFEETLTLHSSLSHNRLEGTIPTSLRSLSSLSNL